MTAPAVSVVLSVHNGEACVGDAVRSVLGQTLADLEIVLVDDGSTDGTPAILAAIRDPRARVLTQPHAGLTVALNRGIAASRGALLARLDADDLAEPERLARQTAFLEAHPEVGLLGTACREVSPSGETVRMIRPPLDDAALRRALIRRNPFVHSSVMLRRRAVAAAGGYDERLPVAQDYDLWLRLGRLTRLATLPEALVTRRLLPGRITAARDAERLAAEARVRWAAVRRGDYPWWCAVFAARAALALVLPGPLRRAFRRARLQRNERRSER